ncbi:MAG: hypothetical protein HOG49_43370 [Candidatus Scalindua sp.]|jgi:hypothetical protein|nr:hypothetical protein [Candidatus Scalindua sp.]
MKDIDTLIDLKQIAKNLRTQGMQCNCDLDNWQPELDTGHSWVCRIHKEAKAIERRNQK